jgi:hypothetical protein
LTAELAHERNDENRAGKQRNIAAGVFIVSQKFAPRFPFVAIVRIAEPDDFPWETFGVNNRVKGANRACRRVRQKARVKKIEWNLCFVGKRKKFPVVRAHADGFVRLAISNCLEISVHSRK